MIEYKEAVYLIDRKRIESFLNENNLTLEKDVEYTVIAEENSRIVATGSVSGNVLKCFAIDEEYRNMAITNTIVSKLIEYQYNRGITHLFIFTKPGNKKIFTDFGFKLVAEVEEVALLDNKIDELYKIVEDLKNTNPENLESGVIVLNANPMTLGHLKLIEEAASQVKRLNLFMVIEDKSDFPYEFRYNVVKNATAHLKNVVLHRGNEYIISKNTFPTYFYKDTQTIIESYTSLDITIFAKYFVEALNIKKRFVGTEVTDIVTKEYNDKMKSILPMYGVEVVEIERYRVDGEIISASVVRKFLKEKDYKGAYRLLPQSTINALESEEGKRIVDGL
ncbi:[citrate (pro-3S)-lyase] ligase [Anaerosphaera multitolerans]|uniref:[Citrate [pro-3S]-lyase] ligase n=1 Tax=Anaerosphaera multitolerans TaxID=2487351 RepID=A0A437S8D8_9FIRM|nr:[citrate (pro-3S)-lyase] ligase [Anaerosphaera multitolerans]RVU55272.1 [citrate (pro-3S)-lyase] ligase [Anaerosphaera multitolerans]